MNNKMVFRGLDPKREICPPFLDIQAAPFHMKIVQHLNKIGLQEPTNVQAQAWPIILSGRDTVCISKSGTGKTLAFAAPLFSNLLSDATNVAEGSGIAKPTVLVLSAKRKEAVEIAHVLKPFADICGMSTTVCTGGYDDSDDISYFKNHRSDVLIATPGRCANLLKEGHIDVSRVEKLVLDETHVLLNRVLGTDTKTVLKKLDKKANNIQTIAVAGKWKQCCLDYEKHLLKSNFVFMSVSRPKLDMTGEPTARAMKTARPAVRKRMLSRWRERQEKRNEAEKIHLTPPV